MRTASGSRLFGSVAEHWIFNPAERDQFSPKSWDFFQPNVLCFVLYYSFYVIRLGLIQGFDLILCRNGLSYDMKAITKNKA